MQQECKCPKCGTVVNAVPDEPEFLMAYRGGLKGSLIGGIIGAIFAVIVAVASRYIMGG